MSKYLRFLSIAILVSSFPIVLHAAPPEDRDIEKAIKTFEHGSPREGSKALKRIISKLEGKDKERRMAAALDLADVELKRGNAESALEIYNLMSVLAADLESFYLRAAIGIVNALLQRGESEDADGQLRRLSDEGARFGPIAVSSMVKGVREGFQTADPERWNALCGSLNAKHGIEVECSTPEVLSSVPAQQSPNAAPMGAGLSSAGLSAGGSTSRSSSRSSSSPASTSSSASSSSSSSTSSSSSPSPTPTPAPTPTPQAHTECTGFGQ